MFQLWLQFLNLFGLFFEKAASPGQDVEYWSFLELWPFGQWQHLLFPLLGLGLGWGGGSLWKVRVTLCSCWCHLVSSSLWRGVPLPGGWGERPQELGYLKGLGGNSDFIPPGMMWDLSEASAHIWMPNLLGQERLLSEPSYQLFPTLAGRFCVLSAGVTAFPDGSLLPSHTVSSLPPSEIWSECFCAQDHIERMLRPHIFLWKCGMMLFMCNGGQGTAWSQSHNLGLQTCIINANWVVGSCGCACSTCELCSHSNGNWLLMRNFKFLCWWYLPHMACITRNHGQCRAFIVCKCFCFKVNRNQN